MLLPCKSKKSIRSQSLEISWSTHFVEVSGGSREASVYGSEAYIKALIAGSGSRARFLFPVVRRGEEVIVSGCFQELVLYREDLDELGRLFASDSNFSLRLENMVKMVMSLGKGKKGVRILIAGNAQVSGPYGLFFHSSIGRDEQALWWSQITEAVEHDHGPFSIMMVKEFAEDRRVIAKALKQDGFNTVPSLPVMVMPIDPAWKSFEDYLQAMASKYRIRAKSARKKKQGITRVHWDAEQISKHLEEIEVLYMNVFSRARFRLYRMHADYFLHLKENLGEEFSFIAYLKGEKMVGFCTSLIYGNKADAHLIGLDYEVNKSHSLYLNMLYDYVEDGILNHIELLDFGRTAMEIKSTVGAVPLEQHALVKMRNSILHGLGCILMENSTPHPWVQRHPFRDEGE